MAEFHVWNLQDEIEKYNNYIEKSINMTPFHFTEYLLAEAQAEDGITKIFCYEDDGYFALVPEVIRKINDLPYMSDLSEELYDMITPHEYGGIISNNCDDALKCNLLKYVLQYCNENNIIFQFIRLNPYLKELPLLYWKSGFEVLYSNAQVYVDLSKKEEQIIREYKSNVRRNIRRAEKEGLGFEIADKSQDNINAFRIMYQKAMEILGARKFLYFNEEYFYKLMECDCSRLAFVRDGTGKAAAGSILLLDDGIVYYHLGCFDRDYSLKRPMNYLMHSMILWSREENYQIFHLAGGHESLMQFKEGYASTRIDYYIANQICDKNKYHAVCEKWKKQFPEYSKVNYYPLYRYNE